MSNSIKPIQRDILSTVETIIDGKNYIYEVEHEHCSYLDGGTSDVLYLHKKSNDSTLSFKHEILNSEIFHNLDEKGYQSFYDKAKEFTHESITRKSDDIKPIYEENKRKLRDLKF